VAELLGHADTTMVMKTYHHLKDQATRAAVNRLPKNW
jgi:integrase